MNLDELEKFYRQQAGENPGGINKDVLELIAEVRRIREHINTLEATYAIPKGWNTFLPRAITYPDDKSPEFQAAAAEYFAEDQRRAMQDDEHRTTDR